MTQQPNQEQVWSVEAGCSWFVWVQHWHLYVRNNVQLCVKPIEPAYCDSDSVRLEHGDLSKIWLKHQQLFDAKWGTHVEGEDSLITHLMCDSHTDLLSSSWQQAHSQEGWGRTPPLWVHTLLTPPPPSPSSHPLLGSEHTKYSHYSLSVGS